MHHTTVFGRIFQRQPTEEIIGIHIDIEHSSATFSTSTSTRQRNFEHNIYIMTTMFCWRSTPQIAQQWSTTSTSCSTRQIFCTIGSLQQVPSNSGGATSGMGINKVQQQWITTVQHHEFKVQQHRHGRTTSCATLSTTKVRHQDMASTLATTSSIRRYGFNIGIDIYIMIIKMDKKSNNHRQH